MFAGPNGSGKSSLKEVLPEKLQGIYLNPDEIEATLKRERRLDLSTFQLAGASGEVLQRLGSLCRPGFTGFADRILRGEGEDVLEVEPEEVDAYFASALVECLREELMERRVSFTFETVMSHASKVNVLVRAKDLGYRSYLYYVATEDVEINVSRVANRVALGGHPVPEASIRSRYERSLGLLFDAIVASNRAYIFDNSGDGSPRSWIAEVTDGEEIELKTSTIPYWFKREVLDKISQ